MQDIASAVPGTVPGEGTLFDQRTLSRNDRREPESTTQEVSTMSRSGEQGARADVGAGGLFGCSCQ